MTALDVHSESLVIVNDKGKTLIANGSADDPLRRAVEDCPGTNGDAAALEPFRQQCRDLLAEATRIGQTVDAEVVVGGQSFHLTVHPVVSGSGESPKFVLRSRDVTAFRQAQAARDRAAMALQEVLQQVEKVRQETGRAVVSNVDRMILPLVHDLEDSIPTSQKLRWDLLKQAIQDITSPFVDRIEAQYARLTPAEIRIAKLVGLGLASKEIARLVHLSAATISKHRENIRHKLGISGCQVNMRSHLQQMFSQSRAVDQNDGEGNQHNEG